jgi:serine/threonine protein phosphatase PrpC
MTHKAYGATDVGKRRESNEDHLLVDPEIGVYAVADGMGGHAAGEVASEIAITTLGKSLRREGWPESTRGQGGPGLKQEIARTMRIAIAEANSEICSSVRERAEWQGMGTTLVALAMVEGSAIIGHVGDSRAYLYRDGVLSRLTSDHSWVNEQVKLGLLSADEAQRHPWRNIVTRALGNRAEVEVDILEHPAASGDLFLLCSDGLNTMLKDPEIETILKDPEHRPDTICKVLIDAANEQGGEDNTTVVALWVE